jgi:cell fate regulator YaaT (PSP1 superfamily)
VFYINSPNTPILPEYSNSQSNLVESYSLFESIILKNINKRHLNGSACFECNLCYSNKTQIEKRNIIEVTCEGLLNCDFCEISDNKNLEIFPQDFILVQIEDCIEVAQVKLVGEMVKLKRHYLGLNAELLPRVIRKLTFDDLEKVRKNIHDEEKAVPIFMTSIEKFNLCMKLVAVHYQFDRKKLFFFYTADGRIDFRELAKVLAAEFKTRIELRQIGVRDEAKKVGGMGTCGREYCCISFLSNFKRITTQLASDQNLLSSMGKLSGPCGKLKCCLSFEVD